MGKTKRRINLGEKIINGIRFVAREYRKGKYLVTAEGYDGEREYAYETWEKRQDGDMTDRRSSFNPENKRWFQKSFTKVVEKVKSAIEDDLEKFKKYIDELCEEASDEGQEYYKRFYRKLVKQYHPDVCHHPNATELFKIVKSCWESITFRD